MTVENMNRVVFTGDTLNIGGVGEFMEGNANQMLHNIDLISSFPGDTKIFCAHEFTLENLEFCAQVEGDNNPSINEFTEIYKRLINESNCSVPSLLENEKLYNVFLRCRTSSQLRYISGLDSPAQIVHFLN